MRKPSATCLLWFALCLPAAAEPPAAVPAAIPDPAGNAAELSFREFARDWMARLARVETQNRSNPIANASAGVNYRGFGDDFRIELRPTGNPDAPWVGLLRYVEHVYECSDASAGDCRVASSMPVTEIFRFRNGAWIY
jgi:hypothetical protein